LVQIEQLHAVTMVRSVVHSNRTSPQWQPPVKVFVPGIAELHLGMIVEVTAIGGDGSGRLPQAGQQPIAHPGNVIRIAQPVHGKRAPRACVPR
jgi:hypothetical protein